MTGTRSSTTWAILTPSDGRRDAELERHPLLPNVPTLPELGLTPEGVTFLRVVASTAEIGRSVLTTPGVPPERLAALRSAFQAMLNDPAFLAACEKRHLLIDGAAATIGPVGEPYTIGFPKPEEFYGFLVTGEYTLVESYARSQLFTSWMMVLVGDPLYNPYAKTPKLKSWEVLPSPRGAAKIFGE